MKPGLSAFLAYFLLALSGSDAHANVVWHQPPDGVVVEGSGSVHAVLEVKDGDPGRVSMSVNGSPIAPVESIKAPQGSVWLHFSLRLESGMNALEVTDDGEIETRHMFFLEAWGKVKTPPSGQTPLRFHLIDRPQKGCGGCHDLDSRKSDAAPPTPEQSSCYPCHRRITAFPQVHGPAAKWACTRCHDPASTPARYATPRPEVSTLCFTCHQDLRETFYASPYQHGPTATGRCTICHDPHGSDNPFWLKRPPWYLCTSCHIEKASGRHVMAWGPSGGTHPTRGKPDPMKPDRELACNSCHNPHAAASPKLWNFGATRLTELCQVCHRK